MRRKSNKYMNTKHKKRIEAYLMYSRWIDEHLSIEVTLIYAKMR